MRRSQQRERALKAWALDRLIEQGRVDRSSILASEYSLPTEELRADLAVLADEFIGVEIKGPLDSLKRLNRQLASYGRIFDRTILVCSSVHIHRIIDRVPSVELWEVTKDFQLVLHHRPCIARNLSGDRLALARAACRKTPFMDAFEVDARESLLASFREKFSDPSKRFWKALPNRAPKADDLLHLSRFVDQRNLHKERAAHKADFWTAWYEQASDHFRDYSVQSSSVS